MCNTRLRFSRALGGLLLLLLGLAGACAAPPAVQELRIVNAGNTNITGLLVLFPGPTADAQAIQVEFGDIPAGKPTEYRSVPGGVYRYAAYQYTFEGRPVNQAVVDWVGEKPMEGTRFTYRIELDPAQQPGGQIQLLGVSTDSP